MPFLRKLTIYRSLNGPVLDPIFTFEGSLQAKYNIKRPISRLKTSIMVKNELWVDYCAIIAACAPKLPIFNCQKWGAYNTFWKNHAYGLLISSFQYKKMKKSQTGFQQVACGGHSKTIGI